MTSSGCLLFAEAKSTGAIKTPIDFHADNLCLYNYQHSKQVLPVSAVLLQTIDAAPLCQPPAVARAVVAVRLHPQDELKTLCKISCSVTLEITTRSRAYVNW